MQGLALHCCFFIQFIKHLAGERDFEISKQEMMAKPELGREKANWSNVEFFQPGAVSLGFYCCNKT